MDWNDIRVLIEVARTGSFTAAAVTLTSSKPTVSRRVAALEQMAGTRLFRRTPQGAILTEAGELVIQRALRIEAEALDMERALRAMKQDAALTVSVRMSEGVAAYLVAPAMAGQELGPLGQAAQRLHLALPPIRILPPDSPKRADVSLVWAPRGQLPAAAPTDRVRRLADVCFVPFHSDTYGVGAPRLERFSDLAEHKLVTMSAYRWFSDDGWAEWHRQLERSQSNPVTVDWSCSVGHLTLRGAGIGLLPTYTPMYSDGMRRLEIAVPPMMASIWMVHDEGAGKDRAVRAVIDGLTKLFKEADWMA